MVDLAHQIGDVDERAGRRNVDHEPLPLLQHRLPVLIGKRERQKHLLARAVIVLSVLIPTGHTHALDRRGCPHPDLPRISA
jgi:hypothetical protein